MILCRQRYQCLLGFFLLGASFCVAQDTQDASISEPLPEATVKTSSLAVFKNGLGFFVRQSAAKLVRGQAMIPLVPEAALGSLWLAPNDAGASLDELAAYRYKAAKEHAGIR